MTAAFAIAEKRMAQARRGRSPGKLQRTPDPRGLAEATRAFLLAAGLDPDHEEVAQTPERVARAWCESFLDGYAQDPREILSETLRSDGAGPVLIRDISFHSICPHHLLPFAGVAHVAYVPAEKVVGFSRLVRLVDCFAHRLTLQERIAHEVAESLVVYLGAHAAACALEAEQGCVTLRGVRRPGSRVWTEAVAGAPSSSKRLSDLLSSLRRPDAGSLSRRSPRR
jgi:GTP cyclohydrolase I